MSAVGTGYDLSASTISPEGRIFQVEYAQKAVDVGGTALGARCKDGVVIGVEKQINSKLVMRDSSSQLGNVTDSMGFVGAGMYPDTRAILAYAREEALDHFEAYRQPIRADTLVDKVGGYMHAYTLSVHRPFGCCGLFATYDRPTGGHLYMVEPSGLWHEYFAWSVGKHRQGSKAELEKLNLTETSAEQMVKELARILILVREEGKDYRLEFGWATEASGGKFRPVPDDVVQAAKEWAKAKIDEEEDDDD